MPIGPYENFNDCVQAQIKKGKSTDSAKRICGFLQDRLEGKVATEQFFKTTKFEDDGRYFIRTFLLSTDVNLNDWGVTASSISQNIGSFIGKPLVLTENLDHPIPLISTSSPTEFVSTWLRYQERFRIGTIIDIVKDEENPNQFDAIIEITDPLAKDAFKDSELPLFVSPAIAHLDFTEDDSEISNWTGIHLAIVEHPAFTTKKAIVSHQCGGNEQQCSMQLKLAKVASNYSHYKLSTDTKKCGFCKKKTLTKYATIIKELYSSEISQKLDNKLQTKLSDETIKIETNPSIPENVPAPTEQPTIVAVTEETKKEEIENNSNNNNDDDEDNRSKEDLLKLVAKLEAENDHLKGQLGQLKKTSKTEAERISELEAEVASLKLEANVERNNAFLASYIADEKTRLTRATKYAKSGLSFEDLKEIYAELPKIEVAKKASLDKVEKEKEEPISRTAKTASENVTSEDNEIKEQNRTIASSILSVFGKSD